MKNFRILIFPFIILLLGIFNTYAQYFSGFVVSSRIDKVYTNELECKISIDSLNAIYAIGSFFDTTYFDNYVLHGKSQDVFFVKFNYFGKTEWALRIGGNKADKGYDLSTDKNSIYIAGRYNDTLNIDKNFVCQNGPNAFVAKYDYNGNLSWVRQGIASQSVNDLNVKYADNYVYLAGRYSGIIQFDEFILKSSSSDIFLVKYDINGNVIWAKSYGFWFLDTIQDLIIFGNNIYIAGDFTATSGVSANIAFVERLDTSGNIIWKKSLPASSSGLSVARSVCKLNNSDDIVLSGFYYGQISLGANSLSANGWYDCFICRIDPNGSIKWATNFGTENMDEPYDLGVDDNNYIFMTGFYNSGFASPISADIMLCQFNYSGSMLSFKSAGGKYDDSGYGLAISNTDIYIAGNFIDSISCGNKTIIDKKRKDFFLWNICKEKTNSSFRFDFGWNIFSSYVLPDNADMKTIFKPLIEKGVLIKIQDEEGKSLEDFGIFGGWNNNIGNLTLTEGYKIKVNSPCVLTLTGVPIAYPYEIPLKAGWNIIGFPNFFPSDGKTVVQQLIVRGSLIKVQDEIGNSIEDFGVFGGWTNNIGNFNPGKGYKIKVRNDDTLTIKESYP